MNNKKERKHGIKKEKGRSRLISLTIKNIKTMFRDRASLMWLIGYPLMIIFIFSLAFGGASSYPNYNIVILNDDTNDSGIPGFSIFSPFTIAS